jgi:uncharacterized protein YbjT (DUF2867 family)
MYAVAGVTGDTGKVVAETLLAQNRPVRVLVRDEAKGAEWKARGAEVVVAELDDPAALSRAFAGTVGAYFLLPSQYASTDSRADNARRTRGIVQAVESSGVAHVVFLSAVGAQHANGTGPVGPLHDAEVELSHVKAAVTSVRAAYFMENWGPSPLAFCARTRRAPDVPRAWPRHSHGRDGRRRHNIGEGAPRGGQRLLGDRARRAEGLHARGCPNATLYALDADVALAEGREGSHGPLTSMLGTNPTGLHVHGLKDGAVTTVGAKGIRAIAMPGHTAGSAAYLVSGVLFLGDAAGITTEGKLKPAPWVFTDDGAKNRASLVALGRMLESENAAVVAIVPAHTGPGQFEDLVAFTP